MSEPSGDIAAQMLIRCLSRFENLDDDDIRAIEGLRFQVAGAGSGRRIVRAGEPVSKVIVLLRGYTCQYHQVHSGARQILSFNTPGELLGIVSLFGRPADCFVQALTAVSFASLSASSLADLAFARPRIGRALWQDTLRRLVVSRELAVHLGRTQAKARVAYFLCDFLAKARDVGLAEGNNCHLPFTQEEIGDAVGLTSVHVNRTLKLLEAEGLIQRWNRTLVVPSSQALLDAAESESFAARWLEEQASA